MRTSKVFEIQSGLFSVLQKVLQRLNSGVRAQGKWYAHIRTCSHAFAGVLLFNSQLLLLLFYYVSVLSPRDLHLIAI